MKFLLKTKQIKASDIRLLESKPIVAQIVAYFPPHLGGMENCVAEISNSLAKKKYDVSVLTSNIGYENGYKNNLELNVKYLKSIEVAHTPIIFSLFFRLLSLPNNSIMHLHVAQAYIPEIVCLISKIKKTPYIAHLHLDVEPSGKLGFLLKPYKKYFLTYVLKNASKVVCLAEDQKRLIAKKYNLPTNKIIVIPNGVGKEFFINHKNKKEKNPHLLFVGRFGLQKNIPLLINAVSLLKHDVILDIVGDGEKRNEIEKLISEKDLKNVILHGQKTKKELVDFYKKADIFVITSQKEGLSLSMLEAMAAGLPVVGTEVIGIKDLLKDVGILAPNNNPKKLAELLDNLLSNKKLQKDLSKKAAAKAKGYRWESVVKMIETSYMEVLNENNKN